MARPPLRPRRGKKPFSRAKPGRSPIGQERREPAPAPASRARPVEPFPPTGSGEDLVFLLTPPGVGALVTSDLSRVGVQPVWQGERLFLRNHDLLPIIVASNKVPLLEKLRVTEDHFLVIARDLTLRTRGAFAEELRRDFKARLMTALRHLPRRRPGSTPHAFTFVTQDRDYPIHRNVIAGTIAGAIHDLFPRWKLREPADVEVWGFLLGGSAHAALRLTGPFHRTHGEKTVVTRPGALRPPVAAALLLFAQGSPGDRILDPMCGSGTILATVPELLPGCTLVGCDKDKEAVTITNERLAARGTPATVLNLDSVHSPLPQDADGAFDLIVVNLPFGKQFERQPQLYREAVARWRDLLAPGGALVALTSEEAPFVEAVRLANGRIRSSMHLRVKGLSSWFLKASFRRN